MPQTASSSFSCTASVSVSPFSSRSMTFWSSSFTLSTRKAGYTDSNGAKRQKWETCGSHAEAKKRKAEIEHQLDTGVFIPPSADTLSDFLDEYVSLYGVNTWAPSTFDGHTALISNYIKPIIGDVKLDDINPRMITKFYKDLQTVKAVPRYGQPEGELISPNTIREIHKLLRNAFNQAVK